MRRIGVAALLCLSCVCGAAANDDRTQVPVLDLANLKVGDVGILPPELAAASTRPCCESRISWKIGDNYFVMEVQCYDVVQSVGESGFPGPSTLQKAGRFDVAVKGVSIASKDEGERIHIAGSLRVTGIAKVKSARQATVYVVEPVPTLPAKKP